MLEFLKKQNPRLYIFIGGILSGLCVIFPQIGFLAYFSMLPSFLAFLYKVKNGMYAKKRSVYADGMIFFMSYYLVIFHWFIYLYPLSFTEMSRFYAAVVVIVAWFGLSLLQSLAAAFNFLWLYLFSKTSLFGKYPYMMPFFAASLWAVLEWTQTLTWAGVPWGRLVLSQSLYTVMLQSASLFGSYFITFIIVSVNFLFAYVLSERKNIKICSAVAFGMVCANLLCGCVLYFLPSGERSLKSAAIQGNMSSHEKWAFDSTDRAIEIYSRYTREAAAEGAKLIVWPETAIPEYIGDGSYIYNKFVRLSCETGATLIVGAFSENEDRRATNSLLVFYPDGSVDTNGYSKQKLVPFGEYLPMKKLISVLIPPLAELNMYSDDLAAGSDSSVMDSSSDPDSQDNIKIGALICFDSIYEDVSLRAVKNGAEMIVMSTNDSWFYDSRAVYMHNYQAKLRAIETGRYIVRAGNTGISSVISDKGTVKSYLPPLEEGYICGDVSVCGGRTLYSITGNLLIYLFIVSDLCIFASDIFLKIRKKKKIKL